MRSDNLFVRHVSQPLANILSTYVINAPSHIILDLSGMLADELM